MSDNVRSLLKQKTEAIWTISSKDTVYFALQRMADKDVGALLVVDHGEFVGIFTERDYARKGILQGRESKNTCVGEVMSKNVIGVASQDTIEDCMLKMKEKNIRHLPVVDDGRLVGVISMKDVVSKIISMQKSTIDSLEKYITGSRY